MLLLVVANSIGFTTKVSQHGQDEHLHEAFFKSRLEGTFVEMGGFNGLTYSNSLNFEREQNWTGVLIEANPALCKVMRRNRPKATCLCTAVSNDSSFINFQRGLYSSTYGAVEDAAKYSGEDKYARRNSRWAAERVPSAPLGYLLRTVGIEFIDLFSLDVEGSEYRVLQSMDWTIPVRVWTIEVHSTSRARPLIAELLSSHGYQLQKYPAGLHSRPFRRALGESTRRGVAMAALSSRLAAVARLGSFPYLYIELNSGGTQNASCSPM